MIVDGTFLKRWQRDLFRREANALGVPFAIVDVTAPGAVLRARIAARADAGGDASEADEVVLTQQIAQAEGLTAEEASAVLRVDSARADVGTTQHQTGEALCARLHAPAAPDQPGSGKLLPFKNNHLR